MRVIDTCRLILLWQALLSATQLLDTQCRRKHSLLFRKGSFVLVLRSNSNDHVLPLVLVRRVRNNADVGETDDGHSGLSSRIQAHKAPHLVALLLLLHFGPQLYRAQRTQIPVAGYCDQPNRDNLLL